MEQGRSAIGRSYTDFTDHRQICRDRKQLVSGKFFHKLFIKFRLLEAASVNSEDKCQIPDCWKPMIVVIRETADFSGIDHLGMTSLSSFLYGLYCISNLPSVI